MDYSNIADRAILDAPVLVSADPLLVQLDIALNEEEEEEGGEQHADTQRELAQVCLNAEYSHLVLLRDTLVRFKDRTTTTSLATIHSQRSEQELELVAEKKWWLVTHELMHCASIEHRYVLGMVRLRSSSEMLQLQRKNGSTKRKKKYKFSLNRKSSKLEVRRQQHWRNQSTESTSSEESNGTTTTSDDSAATSSLQQQQQQRRRCMSPEILAHQPCELETLFLMFRTKRDRRLWKDRLGISIGRTAIDTNEKASSQELPPQVALPGRRRRFEHNLFQDMHNQGYLEPQSLPSMHVRSKSNTAASSTSRSLNVARSNSSLSLLRAKTSTSLTIGGKKTPHLGRKTATAQRRDEFYRHRSGISTKHLLAQRVSYQTTSNFTFGGEFSEPASFSSPLPPKMPPARSKSLAVMKELTNNPLPKAPDIVDKREEEEEVESVLLETVEEQPIDESREDVTPDRDQEKENTAPENTTEKTAEKTAEKKTEKNRMRHLRITDSVRFFSYRKSSTTSKTSQTRSVEPKEDDHVRCPPLSRPEKHTAAAARIATPLITHFEPAEPLTAEIVDDAYTTASVSLQRRKLVRFRSLESVIPTIPESPILA